ncbi:8-oxo-dGTP diphosphatase [Thermovibrio guaymasensis]|uniref:8-oxo-dGTP diphosphatase n=1 Tax=Thermovibrio guaymasensis TaxID=240167 RepID=A0A420W5U5_9BACT|nr:NUDIX hydrolase [Thermovibrio guaymasensis]RKQ60419.1 8-oxo-dGTP diphosphatase [Thermovibrio guaymasensis]
MAFEPKTPYLAVDGIINLQDEFGNWLGIVLIERKYSPVGLAIPGGFVEVGESVERAVIREMKEETSLDVVVLRQFRVFSKPDRDPRFHTVSVVFECVARGNPKGKDDAKVAKVFSYEEIPFDSLVFDHREILKKYLSDPLAVFKRL